MNNQLMLWPVLTQVALTLVLYVRLNLAKIKASTAGHVDESRRGLYDDAWPDYVLKINNCIRNQFEVPVLFFVLALSLMVLDAVDWVSLTLAWLFVASRIAHAVVHTGSNHIPTRRRLFLVGVLLVLVLAVWVLSTLL
ncbi:hypothetical protein SAMN05216203_2146 [Marinobacter daqiaonensis]|uniref:MAPEG family protein n=1 Tax=Marinobacter daqiaonensis TaxID=650891 RepID=A0A1I6IDU9_9GAMM|nr:MAPEG family protein [Marinobacter daqiaonensis]SFR64799.1 hypothetical protein SAMN05216203_2146 [Marinobacter daqiaonensis]